MADESRLADPPFILNTMELVHFNVLFTHLFSVLSGSQSMSAFEINPCKHLTVSALIYGSFPAIKCTDNKPTPMVTSKTAGYIHALIIDTVTVNNSEPPYARAIQNEQMICQELDSIEPEAFRTELVKCLADYYENIRNMEGAGGLCVAKSFKRKFKAIHRIIYASVSEIEASSSQTVDGNDSNGEDAPAGEDATGGALDIWNPVHLDRIGQICTYWYVPVRTSTT